MLKLPWRTETTPATTPISAPSPMLDRVDTPLLPETVHTKRNRKPAKKLYPIIDRRGVIVGTSTTPTPQETAETHAAALLEWLSEHGGFTGQPMLYDLVGRRYLDTFCPALGLKPFAWRAVAKALDALPGVQRDIQYVDAHDGRQRVKKHVYLLPEPRGAVVELDVARKRA